MMGENDFFDGLDRIFSSYGEFMEEHTFISLGLHLAGLMGLAKISDWLSGDHERDIPSDWDFELDEARRRQQQDLCDLQEQLEDRRTRNSQDSRTGDEFLRQAGDILDSLKQKPRLHLMDKQFLHDLEGLETIYHDLEKYSAASSRTPSKGQQTAAASLYRQADAVLTEYLEWEERWLNARQQWIDQWSRTKALLENSRTVQISLNTTEGEETVEIDCIFWSRGALEQAEQSLPPLEQPEDTAMDTFAALSGQAQSLSRRVQEIVRQAGESFLSSQARIQMSAAVLELMESRGWCLEREEDYAFEQDDERETLHLRLISPVGDQLEFQFKPDDTLMMRPEFQGVHNRSVIEQLTRIIGQALQSQGILVRDVTII